MEHTSIGVLQPQRPASTALADARDDAPLRVLVFTNMYPTADAPFYGSFVGGEVDALRGAGVEVDVYYVNGRANKLAYLAMPFGFFARLFSRRYDVVHVHHSLCGLVAAIQSRVAVVWTVHEGSVAVPNSPAYDRRAIKRPAYSRRLKRAVARRVDAVVAVSDHMGSLLHRADAYVIPCGIDLGLFVPMDQAEAKTRVGLPLDRRYVLFPASPARPEKRYLLARLALDRLHEIAPETRDVELVVLDQVPHAHVPYYMNAAETVLMTSAFEASPVTIREALACNVPVVSTAVGDVPGVLDGIEGCHVVEPDADSIALALRSVLALPRRVCARERMRVYSRERQAELLVEVYKRIRRKRRTRRL